MSKHTPGPWFVVDRGSKGNPMMSVMAERIRGKGPSHEVAICATGDSPQEMEDANARLIAAAPELLAALHAVVCQPGFEPDEPYGVQVLAAIAKAEGRKP